MQKTLQRAQVHAKKIIAVLLSLMMVMSFCCASAFTALATQEGTQTGGSITINEAVPGQVYNAYQILYIESYSDVSDTAKDDLGNPTGGNYAYKANSAWADWLSKQTNYVTIDAQGYVTWAKGADAAAFAKLAQAEAAKMTADATATAGEAEQGKDYSTVKFEGLKLGYYLVDTTLGTLCSLDTTNPNVVMQEKNEAPTIDKTVQEDSTNLYGKKNDADIGQTVNFKSTITAQAGAENYVFHDTMSAGLTLDKTSIKVDGTSVTDSNGNDLANDNYTVTFGGNDGCTFEIAFAQSYLDTINAGITISITYSATLNENAVIAGDGNPNTSSLSYGDTSNTKETAKSTTRTYTWDMDILKYGNNNEANVLSGAQFALLNSDKSKVATVVNGKMAGWVDLPAANEDGTIAWPNNTVLTTNANGKIEIDGLDSDTYYLREVVAPAGYNKLANDVEVVIAGATFADNGTTTYATILAKVNNQSGTELPSTGGMGTTFFYIIGGLLVAAAGVTLVVRRRSRED